MARGDAAFARGEYAEALAEYRLALSRGADDANVHLRAAHAFAQMGRMTQARDHFQAAVERNPELRDQAVADLARQARTAATRGNLIAAATAIEAATELEPGVSVDDLAVPLARHYARSGRYARALPFFEKALTNQELNGDPEMLYETAMAHQELGDCQRALVFFEAFHERGNQRQRDEAEWYIGLCSYELGREYRAVGDLDAAVDHLRTTVEVGEPRHLLAQAYFELGEALANRGDCVAAVQAFEEAQRDEHGGPPTLVQRARTRVDQIRFGERPEEGC